MKHYVCNGGCKGKVLEEVLTRSDYKPNRIIFIDDVLKNLTSVQEMLQRTRPETQFIGIHYTHTESFTTFDAVQAEREWQSIQQVINQPSIQQTTENKLSL